MIILLLLVPTASTAAKPQVFVSILPQAWFVERIAGDAVSVDVLVGPGQSPATFDPPARRLRQLARADALLSIGVPMENTLLPGLAESMPELRIMPVNTGIDLRPAESHQGHDHGLYDTHIWLSPRLALDIAANTYNALLEIAPQDSLAMQRNLALLQSDLRALDEELRVILAPSHGASMAVFHPAYGYLTAEYGLHQVAIESEGAAPSPRGLTRTLRRLRKAGVSALFVQPQFSDKQALKIAQEMDLEVVRLDPLAADYLVNMRLMASSISAACRSGDPHEH
jgi:zinc transport system substrate-binding protein